VEVGREGGRKGGREAGKHEMKSLPEEAIVYISFSKDRKREHPKPNPPLSPFYNPSSLPLAPLFLLTSPAAFSF
jgi:hypothetical protein